MIPVVVHMTVGESPPVKLSVIESNLNVRMGLSSHIEMIRADYYDGSYDITPTQERQVFPVQYKTMAEDFIVEPIPSNYGLITWNGSYLMVS